METKTKLKPATRVGVAALAASSIIAGTVGTADAGGRGYRYAGPYYSRAYTRTWSGTWGYSYARHGRIIARSGWYSRWSSAYARSGRYQSSRYAAVYFWNP